MDLSLPELAAPFHTLAERTEPVQYKRPPLKVCADFRDETPSNRERKIVFVDCIGHKTDYSSQNNRTNMGVKKKPKPEIKFDPDAIRRELKQSRDKHTKRVRNIP
jgi:hypothetical protein